MEDFQSKYNGPQVEEMLDQIANGEAGGGGGGITVETDPIFSASPAASITEEKKAEWDDKVDKVSGKGLSTEDFTSALKAKLEGLNNYDDTEIANVLSTLRGDFDKLVSGDTTTAIKSFNDIIAFLDGIQDTQDLSSIIASIQQQIAGKQDTITDLATIRSGAALGATAVQPSSLAKVATSGSYNDLSDKPTIPSAVTKSTVSGWGFGTYSKPSDGIPKTDLASAVQTSLGKADTALQSYTEQYKGTVTGVKVNGSTKSPSSGTVDIGNVVTSIKINGSTKTPSNGVVDLGTISGGSSSGESSGGSTTTDKPIELNPSDSLFEITQEGTYILKCTNNKNYEFRVEKKCSIIMGLETGSSYGAITILHPSGMIYWANNNEPVFEDNKMMELSFYPVLTSLGIYSVLGTWASYDAVFVTENYGDYA